LFRRPALEIRPELLALHQLLDDEDGVLQVEVCTETPCARHRVRGLRPLRPDALRQIKVGQIVRIEMPPTRCCGMNSRHCGHDRDDLVASRSRVHVVTFCMQVLASGVGSWPNVCSYRKGIMG